MGYTVGSTAGCTTVEQVASYELDLKSRSHYACVLVGSVQARPLKVRLPVGNPGSRLLSPLYRNPLGQATRVLTRTAGRSVQPVLQIDGCGQDTDRQTNKQTEC